MAPPSPIITIWALPRLRLRPTSGSLTLSALALRIRALARPDGSLVVIIDARVVAGTDHPDHEHAVRGGRFQGMQLLARQENRLARADGRLAILGPHVPFAREYDDALLVKMPVRRGFRARDVPDELRDRARADALVHEELKVARSHLRALPGVYRDHALREVRIEIIRHGGRPLERALG